MATLGATNPTLADVRKTLDPDGSTAAVVEILNQQNEVWDDVTVLEGNLATGHQTTIRSGLPSSTWRKLNYGVQPTKSTKVQVTDTCGELAQVSEVDAKLANLNGNAPSFLMSEDMAHIEAMNQDATDAVFHGDTDLHPERFMGLAPRFDAISGAENGGQIITGGGASNLTSMYLVVWSPATCHLIYPKGTQAGLRVEGGMSAGKVDLEDAAGGVYKGYRTFYNWDLGMTVRDWRYVVRIANIDYTALTKNAGSGADLTDLMAQAEELIPNLNMGRAAWYCNRTVRSFLRRQVVNKVAASTLTMEEVYGRRVLTANGIPVRRVDKITNAEAAIS